MKYADGNEPGEKKIMKEEKERSSCRSKGYENESGWDPKPSRGMAFDKTEILLEPGRKAESFNSFRTINIWQGGNEEEFLLDSFYFLHEV